MEIEQCNWIGLSVKYMSEATRELSKCASC